MWETKSQVTLIISPPACIYSRNKFHVQRLDHNPSNFMHSPSQSPHCAHTFNHRIPSLNRLRCISQAISSSRSHSCSLMSTRIMQLKVGVNTSINRVCCLRRHIQSFIFSIKCVYCLLCWIRGARSRQQNLLGK